IHLIATMLALEPEKHLNKDELDTKSEQPFDSLDATLSFIDGSKPIRTDELKDRITRNLLTLIETTKNANDEAALVQLDKHINTAKHTFSALLKHKCDAIPVLQKINSNQKIQRQPRFFSTKKKPKPSKFRMAGPDADVKRKLQDRSNWKNFKNGDFLTFM
uniref:Uncharacterized protein n=1 Tax=Clytia hemisphaerica TaxID=252671 RepID=A0A7M5X0J5_9CNID